ncbi:MAG TPA: carbohydrate-binding protein, partial [Cytophagaceae bacterium]
MQKFTSFIKLPLLLLLLVGLHVKSYSQCKGNLIFYDEFDGTTLDESKWNYDIGNGCPNLCGWGNNEKQYYTNSTDNVSLSSGYLNITARHSPNHWGSGSDFTSGKIHTKGKFDRLYGRFEARMKMPTGLGIWPAFWMLPTDNEYGGWPTSGEIDIMEYRGDHTNQTDATLHYGAGWPNNLWDGTKYTLPSGSFNNEFHVFAVEWEPGVIRWYVDNVLIKTETQNPNSLNPASNHLVNWPWDKRFYIILNLAIGGWFTGNPDTWQIVNGTTWPQTLQVDYVRVYDMSPTTNETPYKGIVREIPGKIEAEDYNEGCNTIAYYDTDNNNQGNSYRTDGVDIEECTDAGGGYNVGWTAPGEWLNYNVNVSTTGKYTLQLRVASEVSGKSMHVEIDDVNITGTINIPNTGGWQTWQTVTINNINLTSGNKKMKVVFDTDGTNLNYLNFIAEAVNPTITFNNITKTYGDEPFNVTASSNSSGAITYSITAGNQFADITSNGQVTIKGAGTVTIQASVAAANGYSAGTKTATLTINKKELTATADNKTRTYNTPNPTFTITYSGFVYGENASNLTAQPVASTTATQSSDAGTYSITLSGGSSANYSFNLVNGLLTINKATPTLTYTGATSGTQGTTIALSANTNSGGTISYSVSNGTGTANITDNTLNLTGAGTVTLTISVGATTNYNEASIQQTITINPLATPTITFNNITKTYGDEP